MSDATKQASHPHGGRDVLTAGPPLAQAQAAMILVHGRGAGAASIMELGRELDHPAFALLAPDAANRTWYPNSFLAPLAQNEPHLSSALRFLGEVVERVLRAEIPPERLFLLGFSQGACLTLEYVARNPRHYGGVAGLTGGLIGPDGTPREYTGALEGTPVFLGSSDPDPHVPRARVEETARVLEGLGARVTTRLYPGMPHTINEEELEYVRNMMDAVAT